MDKDILKNPTCSITINYFKETDTALVYVDGEDEMSFAKYMPKVLTCLLTGKLDMGIKDAISNKYGDSVGKKILDITLSYIKDIGDSEMKINKDVIKKILEEPLKLASQSWKESRENGDYNE